MAVIEYGNSFEANSILYTPAAREVGDYISRINDRARSYLNDLGSRFVERVRETMTFVSADRVERLRERSRRAVQSIMDDDDIRLLTTREQIMMAKSRMRRYILSDVELNRAYRQHRISGWDNSVTFDETLINDTTAAYRYVTTGSVVETSDEDEYDYYVQYVDEGVDLLEEHDPLTIYEKQDIMATWERVKRIMQEEKIDPTSPWEATLD